MKLKYLIVAVFMLASVGISKADKLDALRTNKKIIRMSEAQAPYFAIQIIALAKAPQMPSFFKNVDVAREYPCSDGFLRFCVGQYDSYDAAKAAIPDVKALGYDQAFVVNTREYAIGSGSPLGTLKSGQKIDPNKTYTVQLSAFRFPVYLSHFKNIDDVMEFRMKDKIFRYTTGTFKGDVAEQELNRIKALGYKDAHLVELDKYMPFKIE
ncbi:SPOR domain-containing protein [Carboxylicivirga mesophila]|uniref:SPOR domain-containing protein n=1 Tax=Carboxylicivirga mesophila TaxID=1166478 RepID=A0ABS5KHG2_9BACT|nr:SPOR domain-containing protein [Carboxylicivirga mesophila]MBS2213788.1 SPOR domain-containing protein [Carboxylicivirga mesophila]